MSSEQQLSEGTSQRLRDIRAVLLRVHKTLLEFERQGYERKHGRISNSYQFLELVMSDPWFAWLRQLSELIVEMDELLAAREAGARLRHAASLHLHWASGQIPMPSFSDQVSTKTLVNCFFQPLWKHLGCYRLPQGIP